MSYSQPGVSASCVTLVGNIPPLDKQQEALALRLAPWRCLSSAQGLDPVLGCCGQGRAAASAGPCPAQPAPCTPWATAQLSCAVRASSLPSRYSNAVVGEERNWQSSADLQDSVQQDNTSATLY